ncbi:MAG: DUF4293 domain-containing protein [Flavobacteriales bacterium]|nr:DUF4293 domain-containing protein [Flavobacteriales bacterium]
MIQRIQTVWLICGAVCMSLMAFTPFFKDSTGQVYQLHGNIVPSGATVSNYFVHWVVAVAVVLFLGAVVLFKNRPLQLQLVRLNFLVLAGTVALSAMYLNGAQEQAGAAATVNFGMGFFFPIPALVFNWLAAKGIRADERLVKDLNRIR